MERNINNTLIYLRSANKFRIKTNEDDVLKKNKIKLKDYQINKLKNTHSDLLNDENTSPATNFFLQEFYTYKDLTKRDEEFEKVLPMMIKIFPNKVLNMFNKAIYLDYITEELEYDLSIKLNGKITDEKYHQLFKNKENYDRRKLQLDLVKEIGTELIYIVKLPFIYTTLKVMKKPAEIAGLTEMYNFLYNGYKIFKEMKNAEEFITKLYNRELKILNENK